MNDRPILFAVLAWLLCTAPPLRCRCCWAQGPRPVKHGQRLEIDTIDGRTRWAFRVVSPVIVNSPIVRLGDVIQPLDPNMAGWQRLRRSPIGLVPLGGEPMMIERDRLAQAIGDAEATPAAIDWLGPSTIKVIYRESTETATGSSSQDLDGAAGHSRVVPASYARPQPPADRDVTQAQAQRIEHWIRLALSRLHPSIVEQYAIELDVAQAGFSRLKSISGVDAIQPHDRVNEGAVGFHVVARGIDGPVESDIGLTLTAHPKVVVPRKTLARGHRIEAADLTIAPIPQQDFESDLVTDVDTVIGMEVRGSVRSGRPIHRSDLGMPTLVHRGDLVEVRVISGGITVTANAKALADGSASELIEIETLQPRRRLVARVAQVGLVEIISRPPRIGP